MAGFLLIGTWLLTSTLILPAEAARRIERLSGVDYFGEDYATLKGVTLEDCESACLGDSRYRAFTFNTNVGWCFLKASRGETRPFANAVSGEVVEEGQAAPVVSAETRFADLDFLPARERDAAQRLAAKLNAMLRPQSGLKALVEQARAAFAAKRLDEARDLLEQATALAPNDRALWLGLAEVSLASAQTGDWDQRNRLRRQASAAALNAYGLSARDEERAEALRWIAQTFAARDEWRAAIRANRTALALVDDPDLHTLLEQQVAEHGFRLTEHQVDADAANPRICLEFSYPLDLHHPYLSDFVRVVGRTDLAIEPEAQRICIDGVQHGDRYRVQVRPGLPTADGETLHKGAELEVYVRDRSPQARFVGRGYVLPKGDEAAIPVVTVNTERLDAEVDRIGDRGLTQARAQGLLHQVLGDWNLEQIREELGGRVWEGAIAVRSELNREVTTAIPVGELVKDLKPGVYVLTVRPHNAPDEREQLATQWFLVSDLGLTALSGTDGLHVLVRALSTAKPLVGVELRLIAVNNEILGTARTDDQGYVRLPPGLLRGKGGNEPAFLVAESHGDYGFLDLKQPPFDLSDRGVEGLAPPKALDVYLTSERGAYRPGETLYLTALARDAQARAVKDLPLTLIIERPDGVEWMRSLLQDQGEGGYGASVQLPSTAQRGTWRVAVHADPQGPALAELPFLVEDFLPERLDLTLSASVKAIDPKAPPAVNLEARFLYGAPASGLAIEGKVEVRPAPGLADLPGYRFGLMSEELAPFSAPLTASQTDTQGRALVMLDLPGLPPTSRPLEAEVRLRVVEEGGRPVERRLSVPVRAARPRLGVKPLFGDRVDEGGTAVFTAIAIDPEGQPLGLAGARWTLERLRTNFQWYHRDGSWEFEPVTTSERVASGSIDLAADGSARIESRVDWGSYRLRLEMPDGSALPVDLEFDAGWSVRPKTQDTPDLLQVRLDKPVYRVGERARVHLHARFPGIALIMVIDDRLIAMRALEVGEGEATIELPVTADWGPGAYITAALYRPMDLGARRMPARALGLQWATVDPGQRRLAVSIPETPALKAPIRPRQSIEIPIAVANARPSEPLYATVSAVDLGILNLTRFQPPAPDDWYFAQRRLGLEIRDLYSRLIDRMLGEPGRVRTGGDRQGLQIEGPPPTEELLAYHSGVIRLDTQGRGRIELALPEFNGTVRVMVMVWGAEVLGHAVKDLVVRDPIVIMPSLPRFLAPGDRSRLLLSLDPVEDLAGPVTLVTSVEGPQVQIPAESQRLDLSLEPGARRELNIPLIADSEGDARLRIELNPPTGGSLRKTLRLPVRTNQPRVGRTETLSLAPGAELRLDAVRLADYLPATGALLVSAGPTARLDVAGLLAALNRYPYGCAEQLTSRALPLLYLDQVAESAGLVGEGKASERVRAAIDALLSKQSSEGGFGLWGQEDGNDLWLTAYVADFLTRARERGQPVPETQFQMALDALQNGVSLDSDLSEGRAGIAYALYVLARNGRVAIGDLRYLADNKVETLDTPLALAQLAAALDLQGDRERADRLFRAALKRLTTAREGGGYRADYGSILRDGAALLTLAAESKGAAVDLDPLAQRLQALWISETHTSTQEQAWLLLAAHALMRSGPLAALEIEGRMYPGSFYRRLTAAELASKPLVLVNRSDRPLTVILTTSGIPARPLPAGGNGYRIERAYYDAEGRRVRPERITQSQRLVAVITVSADHPRAARLLIDDPLPAGFEIENPHLVGSADIGGLAWLEVEQEVRHAEFRSNRFIAALDRAAEDPALFHLAYWVRAVSPGAFIHPAATVEDMYRPRLRAWSESGRVEIGE
ncbi:alpha-2-macroglobulin [Caldichromatium japonicum]|uniref:Alpha-2-macroglobulin n=2 Tax=Caldichromatium japonicum TaxID=2699430 RepID=A0A6G7VGZ2_9GAMM|nr:alpha-2-macroglobulin [Caldichromatium japonicum]